MPRHLRLRRHVAQLVQCEGQFGLDQPADVQRVARKVVLLEGQIFRRLGGGRSIRPLRLSDLALAVGTCQRLFSGEETLRLVGQAVGALQHVAHLMIALAEEVELVATGEN